MQTANVLPDNYALSVFHDENANLRLDVTSAGKPNEGVVMSNNALGTFNPKFDDVRFQYTRVER